MFEKNPISLFFRGDPESLDFVDPQSRTGTPQRSTAKESRTARLLNAVGPKWMSTLHSIFPVNERYQDPLAPKKHKPVEIFKAKT